MLVGGGIFAFAIGICEYIRAILWLLQTADYLRPDAFTIRAVSQDEFEDVIVPDKPASVSQEIKTQHAKSV